MPELPEVESVRRALLPLRGVSVRRAVLRRADIAENIPARGVAAAMLEGNSIAELVRHGKQLAVVGSSGRVVCVQLGMSGQLLLTEGRPALTHAHAAWELADGRVLTFRDPRRFGGLSLYPSVSALRGERWSALGPDALTHTEEDLVAACRESRRKVKDLLLHQGALAGVGNIYADEALFEAQVRPTRRAHRLSPDELGALSRAVRSVLERAVAAGGSTLRDYVQPDGSPGSAGAQHRAYGRHGQPCLRCGEVLRHLMLSQRTTSYCPGCQR